jgi:hypothetical protein
MMSKKNIVCGVLAVLVVVGLGFLIHKKNIEAKSYSVVYLTTGEVYVGHLSNFPYLELKDAYILQVTKDATDPTKNNFQLNPINQALWAPTSIHLIEKNIVFYGVLSPTSKIAQTIAAQVK